MVVDVSEAELRPKLGHVVDRATFTASPESPVLDEPERSLAGDGTQFCIGNCHAGSGSADEGCAGRAEDVPSGNHRGYSSLPKWTRLFNLE